MKTIHLLVKVLIFLKIHIFFFGRSVFVQMKKSENLGKTEYSKILGRLRILKSKNVYLHINAHGGEICKEMLDLISEIQKSNVETVTFGASSVPANIFILGSHRKIHRRGSLFFHGPSIRVPLSSLVREGDSLSFSDSHAKMILSDLDILRHCLVVGTRFSDQEIHEILSEGYTLNSKLALTMEAVDEIF